MSSEHLPTDWSTNQLTGENVLMPSQNVFYCFLYWNSVNVVKWQLTGSRGDPGESLRQQARLRSRVAILQSSTVSAGPVYSLQLHCFDSTIYSLNRSTVSTVSNSQCRFYKLQSQQVQSRVCPATAQCCSVLFIRSSRVKEVWLACCWNAHRIKARKTSLDNHWQTRRDNRLCKVKITQMKDVELQWLLYVVHCKLCWQ